MNTVFLLFPKIRSVSNSVSSSTIISTIILFHAARSASLTISPPNESPLQADGRVEIITRFNYLINPDDVLGILSGKLVKRTALHRATTHASQGEIGVSANGTRGEACTYVRANK